MMMMMMMTRVGKMIPMMMILPRRDLILVLISRVEMTSDDEPLLLQLQALLHKFIGHSFFALTFFRLLTASHKEYCYFLRLACWCWGVGSAHLRGTNGSMDGLSINGMVGLL